MKINNLLALFVFTLLFSCNVSNIDTTYNLTDSFVESENILDFDVGTIPLIKQKEGNNTCWAVVYAMQYSWKKQASFSVSNALKALKYDSNIYLDLFNDGKGLLGSEEDKFCKNAGLTFVKNFNPSINGWYQELKNHGPLSVTVLIGGNGSTTWYHALLITAIKGDGSSAGTIFTYIDPAEGKKHSVPFNEFISLYEGSIKWPNQIKYW